MHDVLFYFILFFLFAGYFHNFNINLLDRSECTCSVWIEGLDLEKIGSGDTVIRANGEEGLERNNRESGQRWAVGAVRVTPATLWAALEETLTSLVLHHWEALARSVLLTCHKNESTLWMPN